MRTHSIYIGCLVVFTAASVQLHAATLVFNDASDGHSRKQGATVIETTATVIVGEMTSGLEYRGFVSINISALTEVVSTAKLLLRVQTYNNGATSSDFRLFDYTSGAPPGSVIGGDSTARFSDLGSGVLYGATSITAAANPANSFLEINLNSDAVGAINSGSGVYAVGSSRFFTIGLADVNVTGTDNFGVRMYSGTGTGINQLVVQTVPEPATAVLLSSGVLFFGAARLRRSGHG